MSGDAYKIRDQNAMYFMTLTVVGWLDVFIRREYKNVMVDSLTYCIEMKGLRLHAWCLMTSHLHMIASAEEGFKISEILRDFKKHTAKTILSQIKTLPESRRELFLWYFEREGMKDARIQKYRFWKEDNHAIHLSNIETEIIDQKMEYIHQNPIEAGFVQKPEDYLYSSAKDYIGEEGLVKIARI